jgi:hypothetical protein
MEAMNKIKKTVRAAVLAFLCGVLVLLFAQAVRTASSHEGDISTQ